jgi:hypothetical protein
MKRGKLWAYILKSVLWYVGNFIFGCMPLIFLMIVYGASEGQLGFDDLRKQIHQGALLFVCIGMTGGVITDLLQSETKLNGWRIAVLVLFPIFNMGVLLLKYLFVVLKVINTDCFNITNGTSLMLLGFSMVYCIVTKIKLLIVEDNNHV